MLRGRIQTRSKTGPDPQALRRPFPQGYLAGAGLDEAAHVQLLRVIADPALQPAAVNIDMYSHLGPSN
jgi:hypothetical protein